MADVKWAINDGAKEYRCTHVDRAGKPLGESAVTPVPACALNVDPDTPDGAYVQLFARQPDERWATIGPPARLSPSPVEPYDLLAWNSRGRVHRLQLHDLTEFRMVFAEAVLGDGFPLSATGVDLGHELRYTLSVWQDEGWMPVRQSQPLPIGAIMGNRHLSPPPLSVNQPPALLMLFTVDTEAGMHRMHYPNPSRAVDELIFGDFGNEENLGIGLHMDLLEHFGHRGCFFVDILMELQYGQSALERTLESILGRGHEVQLHIHTQHLLWHSDPTWQARYRALEDYDKNGMQHVMELSIDLFERRVGKRPLAYRAGGFQVDDDSLQIVADHGIPFDSSNLSYYRARTTDWTRSRTQPFAVGDVLEFPPSWFLRCDEGTRTDTRLYAPNPTAGDPLTRMLGATPIPHVVNFVSHSFQLMRYKSALAPGFRDEWIETLKSHVDNDHPSVKIIPTPSHRWGYHEPLVDNGMVATVAHLLRRVAERSDARCVTFEDLHQFADIWWRRPREAPTDPVLALDSRRGIYQRKASQVYSSSFLCELERTTYVPEIDPREIEVAALERADVCWRDAIVAVEGSLSKGAREWLCRQLGGDALDASALQPAEAGTVDAVIWMDSLHRRKPMDLRGRLPALSNALRPGGSLVAVAWTLGVGASPSPPVSLPLAELLFSENELAIRGVTDLQSVTALDRPSWERWLHRLGFNATVAAAGERPIGQLELLAEHNAKLRFLDDDELATAAVAIAAVVPRSPRILDRDRADHGAIREPETALAEARRRFSEMQPGDELLADLPSASAILSPTSAMVAWMRAGFEVLDLADRDGSPAVRLAKPMTAADIDRFGRKRW